MKNAPFNITTVLLAVLGISIIAGGIWAVILNALGVSGFWAHATNFRLKLFSFLSGSPE